MGDHHVQYWLALHRVEGIGNIGFKNLLDAFGKPEDVFKAPLSFLKAIPGIGKKGAAGIISFNDWQCVEEELKLAEKSNVKIITCHDKDYPAALLHIYDYPPILYVKGILKTDDVNIAVVGSRYASTYGKYSTEKLCRELAFHGVTVVSGMARGIDSAAHRGAIAGKGRTIAVLGCGLDVIYPPENEKLYQEISTHGAVITEFPFGTPPNAPNFPARNRIISGISLGVVVVEATDKSGSLITARIAAEQGREVFAVPGTIDSSGSKGTNKLIKEGAILVQSVQDILDEIAPQIRTDTSNMAVTCAKKDQNMPAAIDKQMVSINLNTNETQILSIISSKPVDVNNIITSTGWNTSDVLHILLQLELKGLITQLPGKFFIRKKQ